jgi:type III restriction enzyme
MKKGDAFVSQENQTDTLTTAARSAVKYDLIGKLAESTQLTRQTIATAIFAASTPRSSANTRPTPKTSSQSRRLINEQKATVIVEHLAYNPTDETYTPSTSSPSEKRKTSARASRPPGTSTTTFSPTRATSAPSSANSMPVQ